MKVPAYVPLSEVDTHGVPVYVPLSEVDTHGVYNVDRELACKLDRALAWRVDRALTWRVDRALASECFFLDFPLARVYGIRRPQLLYIRKPQLLYSIGLPEG